MTGINFGRVLAGGLAAGLVINASETLLNTTVIASDMEAMLARANLPPIGGAAITYFVLWGFAIGILLVWLYAAIRPRYGPGPGTAICAALAIWFAGFFSSGATMFAMGFVPLNLTLIGWVWSLVEMMLAALVGAWIYREAPAVAAG